MFARTPRLTLRPPWREDAPALGQAIAHPGVVTMLGRAPWPYTHEDAHAFAGRDRPGDDPVFLILAHEGVGVRLVGGIGIDRFERETPELGYWLTPSAWGRGYATEAGRAVVALARETLRLPRLASGHFVDNAASGRVLHKLGFRPTGRVERRPCRARGTRVDCAIYSLDLAGESDGDMRIAA